MGSLGDELSLDLRPSFFVPRTISDFLQEVSAIEDVSEKGSKLNDFVKELEEEMRKIDAFKRELPLCMRLLIEAILVLKEESKKCSARNIRPVLEEFIPLKKRNRDVDEDDDDDEAEEVDDEEEVNRTHCFEIDKEIRDKKNWMSSVQLWSTDNYPSDSTNRRFPDPRIINRVEHERNEERCKNGSSSRAFLPFRENTGFLVRNEKEEMSSAGGLSLLIPAMRNPKEEIDSGLGLATGSRMSGGRGLSNSATNPSTNFRSLPQPPPPPPPPHPLSQQQAARKQRRCWSPDLHRRFVNALQQLGGSQVATPKQIRELMQVEGLTNDEVKSHLQKYRLHTRKHQSGNSNSNATPEKQSVVVMGGTLWNSQENLGAESSKVSSSQSGSPQGPLQLAAATTTMTGGDSMEDDDDAKSESFSWKGLHNPKPLKGHL